jgi:hypothetical protein
LDTFGRIRHVVGPSLRAGCVLAVSRRTPFQECLRRFDILVGTALGTATPAVGLGNYVIVGKVPGRVLFSRHARPVGPLGAAGIYRKTIGLVRGNDLVPVIRRKGLVGRPGDHGHRKGRSGIRKTHQPGDSGREFAFRLQDKLSGRLGGRSLVVINRRVHLVVVLFQIMLPGVLVPTLVEDVSFLLADPGEARQHDAHEQEIAFASAGSMGGVVGIGIIIGIVVRHCGSLYIQRVCCPVRWGQWMVVGSSVQRPVVGLFVVSSSWNHIVLFLLLRIQICVFNNDALFVFAPAASDLSF